MASLGSFLRSNSSSRTAAFVFNELGGVDGGSVGEIASIQTDMDNLTVSKRLARNISQKLKKKKKKKCSESFEDVESDDGLVSFSGCLSSYVKSTGCKVGACEDLDINCRGRLISADDCKPGKSIVENAIALPEKFWRKGSRKDKGIEQRPLSFPPMNSLPDDLLEMILVMLPWTSLIAARRVCRKWRCIIGKTHFMQRRSEGSYQRPCLFLFGITRNGFNGGEIHALDVSFDRWHRSSHNALKNCSLFSVASIGTEVYIVGGCSSFVASSSSLERSSKKTLKEVLVFSPIKGSFHEAAPMKEARSEPILGVFEVTSSCNIFHSQIQRHCRTQTKSHAGGNSDVYEDPHRLSLRRQLRDAFQETENLLQPNRKLTYSTKQRNIQSKFALISVGGHGSWDEPLDSGEIYDPITNRWVEIARLPASFGPVCSGTVCNCMFYVYSETDKLAGFDLEKGCWMMIQVHRPPPRLPDYYPKLVSCRTRLFMLCVSWCDYDGLLNRREKAVRKMWELDLKSHSWSEVSRHPDAPMDWNASFFADQNKIYGVEMFRIFGQVLDFVTACNVSDSEIKWNRISRKHAAHEADASSCITKSMLVVNL
ncbi:F-box/kelch-repeat protein At5g42350-like [Dendrobium catenatum]|uniref:F-box/kelch-repeat protein n=1 Tax=Dendrobium catenatum TaxID=906689 RepID=A0A2I0WKC7_9ASPA|nr:F-box/kelch-repeat protein At5g42350-like [Dendrobium catenatum]XP_028552193.1 F-box/kelch-repeat protein At5g42350-like [Dendrobium catenatum]XP_028552194.1 F-box/kelch-repeat protein At5g42350-like [Dendrobium catenatum]PKU76115.1 F-box/kelch-repeat protein [Dendrobium catenatum]